MSAAIVEIKGNYLAASIPDREMAAVVERALTFRPRSRTTYEEYRATGNRYKSSPVKVFRRVNDRIQTNRGFLERIVAALKACGSTPDVRDYTQYPPRAFAVDRSRLEGFSLRPRQDEFIDLILAAHNARISCPPGFGKTECIGFVARILPNARINVVVAGNSILEQRIYPLLSSISLDAGLINGKTKRYGARLNAISAASMHRMPDCDILFFDECQDAAAETFAARLCHVRNAKMFGLSGSHDLRSDDRDYRCEGLFGPIRMTVTYDEAVRSGAIVPIRVHWRRIPLNYDPAPGMVDAALLRAAIWRNEARNRIIAEDAKAYGPDVQKLISVTTVEHGFALKKLLPGFTLIYRPGQLDPERKEYFARQGLVPADFEELTPAAYKTHVRNFESGDLKNVIATTVWNVGVSFNKLQVLLRAGFRGQGDDIQVPGRTSRLSDGKPYGIIHDYCDAYNDWLDRRWRRRYGIYASQNWEQISVDGTVLPKRRAAAAIVAEDADEGDDGNDGGCDE